MIHTIQEIHLHKPFLFFLALLFPALFYGQDFPAKEYPQNDFIYPVEATISLSANFGELRSNHYHMGLDCRTNQTENKRVKAAADGYVMRVTVAPFGFGRAIYVRHPNGYTTVYGHLNKFYPALETYLTEQQYLMETWAIDLEMNPEQFPVKQGQFIAYSGNTGGSMGPHLHFEIRDNDANKVYNPLLFNMPIPDKVPPTLVSLYMYDRCKSTYSQTPRHLPIKRIAEGRYATNQAVIPIHTDRISFGIHANDKQSGSNNPNGIYEAVIYLDGNALTGFQLDDIDYLETRYLNAHIDYKKKAEGGPYVQHLSRLPGYPQGVYRDFASDGVIELTDNLVHDVKIVVKDPNGNASELSFKIQQGKITENAGPLNASFYDRHQFHPGFVNVYEDEQVHLYLPETALYDSVTFTHAQKASTRAGSVSNVFTLLSGVVPSHNYFTVKIKPTQNTDSIEDKILMKQSWGSRTDYVKAERQGDWYVARFRTFGDFELIADTTPPVIGGIANGANLSGSSRIVFTPRDNTGIKSFNAYVDGQWLLFTNDKGRNYIYVFDERVSKGKHQLRVVVEDLAGNVSEREITFTR